LGVARLRARLRCLRTTINHRRLYRSLDSATRNDFLWGRLRGPTAWGKENSTPGISGSQGNLEWLGDSVGSLRGLGRIRGLVAWLMVATFLSPVGACPSAAFLPTAYAVGCALSPLRGYSLFPLRGYCLSLLRGYSLSCFAPFSVLASRLFCVAASRLVLYRRFRGYSWKVGAAGRRKNAAHGASRG